MIVQQMALHSFSSPINNIRKHITSREQLKALARSMTVLNLTSCCYYYNLLQ
jgi:hypothetical protein